MGKSIRKFTTSGQYRPLLYLSSIALIIIVVWYWATDMRSDVKKSLTILKIWEAENAAGNTLSEDYQVTDALRQNIENMNAMGESWTTLEMLEELFEDERAIVKKMRRVHQNIQKKVQNSKPPMRRNSFTTEPGASIEVMNLAAISCDAGRRQEFTTMLKSAIIFSQDVRLHLIVFSDQGTIMEVAQDVLRLKWTVNALGFDFTYEFHLEWFPNDGYNWRDMYATCATQRLFFPIQLPHIDALIYLDADILVMSNLTNLWLEFKTHMRDKKMAAMSFNNENTTTGWYDTSSKIPYYGSRGLNAGVMLMNLTQMRDFKFHQRAMAAQALYDGKIELADQDIVNIIFHGFPERLHELPCSYNFNWVHCEGKTEEDECFEEYCFCNATFTHGVQLFHGNSGTFTDTDSLPFAHNVYIQFNQFRLLQDSPADLLRNLRNNFTRLQRPCGPLTARMLFSNVEKYLRQIYPQFFQPT